MIVFLTTLTTFKDQPWVAGMTQGVIPVVAVMLAVLNMGLFEKIEARTGLERKHYSFLSGSFLLIELLDIHPGIVIAFLLAFALFKPDPKNEDNNREKRGEAK